MSFAGNRYSPEPDTWPADRARQPYNLPFPDQKVFPDHERQPYNLPFPNQNVFPDRERQPYHTAAPPSYNTVMANQLTYPTDVKAAQQAQKDAEAEVAKARSDELAAQEEMKQKETTLDGVRKELSDVQTEVHYALKDLAHLESSIEKLNANSKDIGDHVRTIRVNLNVAPTPELKQALENTLRLEAATKAQIQNLIGDYQKDKATLRANQEKVALLQSNVRAAIDVAAEADAKLQEAANRRQRATMAAYAAAFTASRAAELADFEIKLASRVKATEDKAKLAKAASDKAHATKRTAVAALQLALTQADEAKTAEKQRVAAEKQADVVEAARVATAMEREAVIAEQEADAAKEEHSRHTQTAAAVVTANIVQAYADATQRHAEAEQLAARRQQEKREREARDKAAQEVRARERAAREAATKQLAEAEAARRKEEEAKQAAERERIQQFFKAAKERARAAADDRNEAERKARVAAEETERTEKAARDAADREAKARTEAEAAQARERAEKAAREAEEAARREAETKAAERAAQEAAAKAKAEEERAETLKRELDAAQHAQAVAAVQGENVAAEREARAQAGAVAQHAQVAAEREAEAKAGAVAQWVQRFEQFAELNVKEAYNALNSMIKRNSGFMAMRQLVGFQSKYIDMYFDALNTMCDMLARYGQTTQNLELSQSAKWAESKNYVRTLLALDNPKENIRKHCYLLDASKVDVSVLNVARRGILMLANISFDDIIRANQACSQNPTDRDCFRTFGSVANAGRAPKAIAIATAMRLYSVRAMLAGAEAAVADVVMDEAQHDQYARPYLTTVKQMVERTLAIRDTVPEELMQDLTTVGLGQLVLYQRPETPEPAKQVAELQANPGIFARMGGALTSAVQGVVNAIPWGPVDGYFNGEISDDEDENEDDEEDENEDDKEDEDEDVYKF